MHDQSILYWAYKERVQQGRPLNVNHEAACFICRTGGKWKRCSLPESGAEERAFFNGRSKIGGEVGGFCFITPGGDERPWGTEFTSGEGG